MTDPNIERNELTAMLAVAFFERKWPNAKRTLDQMDERTVKEMYVLASDAIKICSQFRHVLDAPPLPDKPAEKPNYEEFVGDPEEDRAMVARMDAEQPEPEEEPLFASREETEDGGIPF